VETEAGRRRIDDDDVVGERLPAGLERGDGERRFSRAAVAEQQERSPVAHDSRPVQDEAVMARQQPCERQVHACFEVAERGKVGEMRVGA
jgi:hypothetical protein